MDLNLKAKTVLVAGSSRGIGLAIANAFAREGCSVAITGRDPESLEKARESLATQFGEENCLALLCDFTDKTATMRVIEKTVKAFGSLDVVVANVGSGLLKAGLELSEDDWQKAFNTNLWASRNVVEASLPVMKAQRAGSLIFIGSIVALDSLPAPMPYTVAKTALLAYSKSLASLVASSNIRVNYVAPGNVLFENGTWDIKLKENRANIETFIQSQVPMQRFGKPEEIADVVLFLASERASFITGACLAVDGGQTKGF